MMESAVTISTYDNVAVKDFRNYYQNVETYFLSWYLPLMILVGFIGGIACIIFLILSKLFPKNVLIWMISICVGDLMILGLDAGRMLIKIYFQYDVRDMCDVVCKVHNFLSNYFFYWSSYMQACMSVQRLTFMLRPLQARSLFTDSVVVGLFSVVSVLVVGPTMPYLTLWQISNDTMNDCEPRSKDYYRITTILDIIFWGIIPLATMTASTIGISVALFRAKSQRSILTINSQQRSDNSRSTSQQNPPDNAWHVTRLLIGMNVLYLVSSYPLLIYQIYLNTDGNRVGKSVPQQLHKSIYYVLRSFCYFGCSWNWVFYCMGGKKFRDRAVLLVRKLFANKQHRPTITEAHTKLVSL